MADPPDEADKEMEGEMAGAAAQMRAGRAAAGMSLQDVADLTRVPLRHLAALEEGDFSALPGTTYCAGFARAYARAVGLNEVSLVAQMRREIDDMGGLGQDAYEFEEAANPGRIPPRWLAWAAALVALLLAGGYGLWRMQLITPPTDEQMATQRASQSKAQNAVSANRPTSPISIAPAGPVVMTAADDVWLRVYEPDGTRLFEGTLARGQSYTVPPNARNPMILTGRPDALALTVGGQAIPPLGTAERTISDVPVSAAALLARASQPAAVPAPASAVTNVADPMASPPAQTASVKPVPTRTQSSPTPVVAVPAGNSSAP